MRFIITEQQYNLIKEGPLDLNLSKQIRRYQQKKYQKNDKMLEDIFGKNIYRLYYDTQTGKQIFPTRKNPNIKFDVSEVFDDEFKKQIETVLNHNDFNMISFENNIAQNTKNNQQIKITKVLHGIDNDLLIKYNRFLDKYTKNTEEQNLYAVISRHPHDISSMGSYENFLTCMDLTDIKDIKQTSFGVRGAEGGGSYAEDAFEAGSVIFYLIKENDWNIQNPIARVTENSYCHGDSAIYGNYKREFDLFIKKWLDTYHQKYFKDKYKDDNIEIKDESNIMSMYHNTEQRIKMLRYIILNNKHEIIRKLFEVYGIGLIENIYLRLGHKALKKLPQDVIQLTTQTIKNKLTQEKYSIINVLSYINNLPNEKINKMLTKTSLANMFNTLNIIKKRDGDISDILRSINPNEYDQLINKYRKYIDKNGDVDQAKIKTLFDEINNRLNN